MLDDFFERGGNVFDTAYIYAQGECERLLGGGCTGACAAGCHPRQGRAHTVL
ncbi:MAG: hypothetical protein WKH64_13440 [Chloroflexia bacterium]